MEIVIDKCSMCQARDMVPMPHANGGSVVFMGCPNCDGPTACSFPKCDLPGCKEGVRSVYPAMGKAYLGVGPNSDRP